MSETENLVLILLREMRAEMTEMRADMASKRDLDRVESRIADVNARVNSLAADVASDLLHMEKSLSDQIFSLHRA